MSKSKLTGIIYAESVKIAIFHHDKRECIARRDSHVLSRFKSSSFKVQERFSNAILFVIVACHDKTAL